MCWLDRHSPTTVAPNRSKVDLIKTKNPVGYSPTRSLFHRGFCNDFRGLNPACGVSSKCSPPELRSYKQNQGRGYLFRTLPEVNPKFSIPQKFSGTKDVGACWLVVGRRGLHSHGLGGQEENLRKCNCTYAKFYLCQKRHKKPCATFIPRSPN